MKSMDINARVATDTASGSIPGDGPNRIGVTTSKVAAQLRRRILEGEYSYEERLPAERSLAEEFDVSRGTSARYYKFSNNSTW